MDPKDIAEFNDSLVRCLAGRQFLDRFYQRFLASSPEVARKFESTDFSRQKRMLRTSLYMTIMAAEGDRDALSYLERIARRHGADELDIGAELYDLWMDSLVGAAQEHDPEFSERTARAWRTVLSFGVEFMRARHEAPAAAG